MPTNFSKRAEILATLWMDYRDETDFKDFIDYNDMGLPLSYYIHEGIVAKTPEAEMYINETYELFIAALEGDIDEEYDSLEDLLMRFGK